LDVLSEVRYHGNVNGNGGYNHNTISLDGIVTHEAPFCARGGGGSDIWRNL